MNETLVNDAGMLAPALPPGPLVAYYGDDFTGASAVMEVMTFAGLPSVMFLDTPTPGRLARFRDCRCIGMAGVARAKDPAWMDIALPPAFAALKALGAPLVHYKVCSTFDSAPEIGSIGRATDIGAAIVPGAWIPLVVGAPEMARYQVFGQLFAGVDGVTHRIDRHPTMARHPVTPMHEADLRLHLARQTSRRIDLIDCVALKAGRGDGALASLPGGTPAVFIDVLDDETLAEAGRLLWDNRDKAPFVAGSQGVEYALVAHWRRLGLIAADLPAPKLAKAAQIAVVSGSCSPVTAGQIAHAGAHGFTLLRLDAAQAVDGAAWRAETARAGAAALAVLGQGGSPLVFTALGPDDPAVRGLAQAVKTAGADLADINARIGAGLGAILSRCLSEGGIRRAVVAGGDTSGEAVSALGVYALSAAAAIATGAPLCRAFSDDPAIDGVELALKGGQTGRNDYFSAARNGAPLPNP